MNNGELHIINKPRKRFRINCHICGRITWHPKACENDHSNMMERYDERMEAQSNYEQDMEIDRILSKHPKWCDCQGCLSW